VRHSAWGDGEDLHETDPRGDGAIAQGSGADLALPRGEGQGTAQIACLSLMAKKIAMSQSTSGDMPDTGLDVLNQEGDSIEVALAKQLVR
jgi:hypothetical protein